MFDGFLCISNRFSYAYTVNIFLFYNPYTLYGGGSNVVHLIACSRAYFVEDLVPIGPCFVDAEQRLLWSTEAFFSSIST